MPTCVQMPRAGYRASVASFHIPVSDPNLQTYAAKEQTRWKAVVTQAGIQTN